MRDVRGRLAGLVFALCCVSCVSPLASHGTAARPAAPYQQLAVMGFAGLDGRLAVEVRNDSTRPVGTARAVILARDRLGSVVAAASGPAGTPCCLVTDLPHGATTVVYADLGAVAVQRVTSVAVTAVPVPRSTLPARTVVGGVALQTGDGGAVVRVQLSTRPAAVLAVRAELVDMRGHIVTAAGARVPCHATSATLPVPSPLPPATVVRSVSAQAVGAC